jgi:hypothetical protein
VRRAVEIRGLDGLGKRFAALGAMKELRPTLRAEAEAVAAEAHARLSERDPDSRLARSIKIRELGTDGQLAYAVGTDETAGSLFEFGTRRRRAEPWLVPALHTRLLDINHAIRKVIAAALKAAAKV